MLYRDQLLIKSTISRLKLHKLLRRQRLILEKILTFLREKRSAVFVDNNFF
jgi:hypothetical protein